VRTGDLTVRRSRWCEPATWTGAARRKPAGANRRPDGAPLTSVRRSGLRCVVETILVVESQANGN